MSKLIVSGFFSLLYLIFSAYHALNVEIAGDTEEYFSHFSEITHTWFPFGLEFVVSILMLVSNALHGGFELFIFANYILWLPLVIFLSKRIEDRPEFILIVLFLLSSYFFDNAAFLIRQYEAVILFIYFIYFGFNRVGFVFLVFSIGAHFYAFILLLMTSPVLFRILFSPVGRLLVSLLMVFTWLNIVDVGSIVIEMFDRQWEVFGSVITRKISGMQAVFDEGGNANSSSVAFINYLIVIVILIFGAPQNITFWQRTAFVAILVSSIMVSLFVDYPILANRAAFITYFFSIPSLILVVGNIWNRRIKFL